MFKDNFVVSIKSDGKFLREVKDLVEVPFGTEYTLYLKNLNDSGASVNVLIDGEKVFDLPVLIPPNSDIEVKGKDGFAFKFIQKTKKISKHRGDKPLDSLLRIEFQLVEDDEWRRLYDELLQKIENQKTIVEHHYHPWYHPYWIYETTRWYSWDSMSCVKTFASTSSLLDNNFYARNIGAVGQNNVTMSSAGLTVPGSEVEQQVFKTAKKVDTAIHSINLRLVGWIEERPVEKPTFSKTKIVCNVCGTRSRSSVKYCPECGVNLKAG